MSVDQKKLEKIKLIALDFDGTLTVGAYVIVNQEGIESVICSRRDGLGIDRIKKAGIEVVVISKETNPVVMARCNKLGIKCWQAINTAGDKLGILQAHATERGLQPGEICYGGDDVNDLDCMNWVGFSFTVADGHMRCKEKAMYVTESKGGEGAVREICELLLSAKGNDISKEI